MEAKDTKGKLDYTLVPTKIITEIAKVREYGTKKYGDSENWRKVPVIEYKKALYRHWIAYIGGEEIDPESLLPHMSHIACNCAFIMELE